MKQINEIQCQSCGQMYFDDNNFCPFCGVENKNKKRTNYNTQTGNQEGSNNQNKISDDTIILIILLIVFWPAALIYYLVKMKK